jgi:hypothetical protein
MGEPVQGVLRIVIGGEVQLTDRGTPDLGDGLKVGAGTLRKALLWCSGEIPTALEARSWAAAMVIGET